MSESYDISMLKVRMAELHNSLGALRRDLRVIIARLWELEKKKGEGDDSAGTGESPATLHVAEGS